MWIPGNEIADGEAKAALEDDFLATEKNPPQQLINWIKTEDKKITKTRWQNSGNIMKNKKKGDRMEKRHKKNKNKMPGHHL
jgi:hypothetical protein